MICAPGQRGEPRGLRVPLVPADAGADRAVLRGERAEAEVAGREVELLVVVGIVGDVHLAIDAGGRAVGVEDDRRVVVQPGRAALEQRADDDDAVFLGGGGEGFAGRTGNRLGEVELAMVFALAEVQAGEQLLQADHLSAGGGGLGDARKRFIDVLPLVGGAGHLD